MSHLDAFCRPIEYLRISVTDRCNLRCIYCMPAEGIPQCAHGDILRYEEIALVVRAAAELGIHKVRLTGGEPLARLGLADLVHELAGIPGIGDLSMTTNGTLLARHAQELRDAGLKRVNISLDTLRPERFTAITRFGTLSDVLDGVAAAHEAGLEPVKINTVVIRGMNDDEIVDLARKTLDADWHVRFIEWMPVGENVDWEAQGMPAAEMRSAIEGALGPLGPARISDGAGPARYFRLPGARGSVGFITPVSEHFCDRCNRLRLTADGYLRPCLLSDVESDLRTPLRQGAGLAEIKVLLEEAIANKPARHHLAQHQRTHKRAMSQIGG